MHRDEDHFKPESQYEEEMWGMKAVEVGLTKIADKLPDHGATAAKSIENAVLAVSGSLKYLANAAVIITIILVTSKHLKY
jgi:hypothetical protein